MESKHRYSGRRRPGYKAGGRRRGSCRSEHMFFGEDRIYDFIRMIIAEDAAERNRAIAALKPYQKDDFKRIFRIMEDRPVTIRLLDPSFQDFYLMQNQI